MSPLAMAARPLLTSKVLRPFAASVRRVEWTFALHNNLTVREGIEESEKPLTPTNALMRTAISYTHEVNRVPSTAIARSDLGEVMRCGEKDTALVNDHLLQNEVGRELEVHLVAHWDSNNKKNIQIKRIYIKIP